MTNRLTALTDIGGVNSIRSFTRSWQRAAGFPEVIPQRPSFVFAPDQAPVAAAATTEAEARDVSPYAQRDIETGSPSLIRQQLQAALQAPGQRSPRAESPEPSASHGSLYRHSSRDSGAQKPLLEGEMSQPFRVGSHTSGASGGGSIFAIPPHLATPSVVGSYGSGVDYGTIRSDVGRESMAEAAALWREQQETGGNVPDSELPPILVKEVEQDGKIVLTVEGQSTLPQTVFNSTKYVLDCSG
jgi:vesicular inhibitory amino acid transporter